MENSNKKITVLTDKEKDFILKYRKLTPESKEKVYLKMLKMAKQEVLRRN